MRGIVAGGIRCAETYPCHLLRLLVPSQQPPPEHRHGGHEAIADDGDLGRCRRTHRASRRSGRPASWRRRGRSRPCISVTTTTIRAIGRATCRPVRICGRAAGSRICHSTSRSRAPMLRADHRAPSRRPRCRQWWRSPPGRWRRAPPWKSWTRRRARATGSPPAETRSSASGSQPK